MHTHGLDHDISVLFTMPFAEPQEDLDIGYHITRNWKKAVQVTYANSWYVCYFRSQSAHILTGLIKIQTFWKKTFDSLNY